MLIALIPFLIKKLGSDLLLIQYELFYPFLINILPLLCTGCRNKENIEYSFDRKAKTTNLIYQYGDCLQTDD
ncbi:MAG: hypothetical protein ACI8XB_001001 [Patiriisocius sp.]|jgi:hypothetical protein